MNNSENSIKELQENLATVRKLYGWSMEELGEKVGVTKQTICNLEHGNPKMGKIQYIALRSVFETEAGLREAEEKENLLRILTLICDGDPNVSEKQRKEAIEVAKVAAGAMTNGIAAESVIKVLAGSLGTLGVAAAMPVAVPIVAPVVAGVVAGSWLVKLVKEKKKKSKE